ncbi:MAG: ATP synthase F1 subunit gamma [Deltaproteobacteria bacterium]|nr:ATP synthase F1 subunit gamma [Deltaproteobacteria bacterium]
MLSSRAIQRRLKTVLDTGKVAKAMKAVSVSKMRKAEQALDAATSYHDAFLDVIARIRALPETSAHPLLQSPGEDVPTAVVVLAADRGLCGSYNQRVLDLADAYIDSHDVAEVCTLGRKALRRMERHAPELLHDFAEEIGSLADWEMSRSLSAHLQNLLERGHVDQIVFVQNRFVNAMTYDTDAYPLLPLSSESGQAPPTSPIVEPEAQKLVLAVLYRYMSARVQLAVSQAIAAEHAARMVAMTDAYDNCMDLRHSLTIQLNKLRQASITKELLEIVSGAEALKGSKND